MMALQKYNTIKVLGNGSYGTVWQAINLNTGEIVAIKVLKNLFYSKEECMKLPEIKIVKEVMSHANIVKVKEAMIHENIMYIVFEFMEGNNLYNRMVERQQPFYEAQVKRWCLQVLQGLSHVHRCGFIHRDIKPENLLLTWDNNVKIGDFGLALDMNSVPDMMSRGSCIVGTINYIAPEILLGSRNYDQAVDFWSVGATMAELLSFYPLFESSNARNQLLRICQVMGSPKPGEWDEGFRLAKAMNFEFPNNCAGIHGGLSALIPNASAEALDMIRLLCSWNPKARPTITQILRHPFFRGTFTTPPVCYPRAIPPPPPGFIVFGQNLIT